MRRHHVIGAALVTLAVLLSGCASNGTKVILLPQADGSPSAVVVSAKGGEQQVVGTPYQRATVVAGSTATPKLDEADPAKVQADNETLFKLIPPRPERFVLYFAEGGTALTPESQRALDTVVTAATGRTGGDITVTGHTDTTGDQDRNDDLSLRRAEEIAGLLVSRGFPRERLEAVGRGERELAVPTADNVAESRNRRVVVQVR